MATRTEPKALISCKEHSSALIQFLPWNRSNPQWIFCTSVGLHTVNNVCILDYLVQNHCSRCDFENKTFHALQPIKFHHMTKFILLSLQSYSVNIVCVMHFCDRSYKIIFLDGQLSSVITVTLQYLHRRLTVSYTRFTEKNKVWAKDVLFIMNFKCAPLRSLGGRGCI